MSVLNNGSCDHGTVGLSNTYPDLNLQVVCQVSNLGFAAGNNLGMGLAGGKWLVLLNAEGNTRTLNLVFLHAKAWRISITMKRPDDN